ncbi:uncharacterized protein BDZ99DRAFT_265612 [Mytilinidion resinicola]|uniref:Peroxin/Ferlin domain-containing protein n=1 Tax=Mytilinidion resinicola TaxID=574789 RepID=A0A6A6YVG5_9PEZI|nr:uncharacterized protein BDZ99DRAFT_265612 [Mytilinidion resinicola]KAF2812373.1 hypothetical protein BDZ99DRAFT_265612 [Mytilinidion resinicola]
MAEAVISLVDHTEDEREEQPQPEPEELSAEQSHVDILYENQRGWFIFGIPLFSSKALGNLRIDQSPWVNSRFEPSVVNITNAQVPDPSWTWEWKTWYVDMSHDVDEEGWQYSFYFRKFAWHGNHPWFHSFVRRRRWLRKRVKRKLPPKTKDNRERLFGDTFSIGTTLARTTTGRPTSLDARGTPIEESVDEEIRDMPTLMSTLKKAPIDREKIVAVKRFINDSGEDLIYLAENMPAIMSMLIFQNSRRQLLTSLMRTFDAASAHREEHKQHEKPEDEVEGRRIDNLLKAVKAADDECKALEYWSDIRGIIEKGETVGGANDAHGWDHKWEGVDSSGPAHP